VIDTAKLKEKILDLAIRGKLVSQDPNDEPASVLLEKIRAEKLQMVKEGKLKQKDIKDDTVIFVGEDNLHYEKFGDGSIKCIEDEIPFKIPNTWCWIRLKDITSVIQNGASIKQFKEASGIPITRIETIASGDIDESRFGYANIHDIAKYSSYVLEDKDILMSHINSPKHLGKCALYTKKKPVIHGMNLLNIRLVNKNVADFIYNYFLTNSFKMFIWENMKHSVNQASFNISLIEKCFIPIPPLNEQKRISYYLADIINLIEGLDDSHKEIIDNISSLKSKILDLAIRGKLVSQDPNDEPADVLLERIRKEKEELIKQGKIKRDKKESIIFKGDDNSYYEKINGINSKNIDSELPFNIPNSWTWCRLGNLIQVISGVSYDKKDVGNGSIRILRGGNINDLKVEVFDDDVFLPEEYYDNEKQLQKNDIVIVASTGSKEVIGKPGFITTVIEKTMIGAFLRIIRSFSPETTNYIQLVFSSDYYRNHIRKLVHGNTINNIKTEYITDLIVPVPPQNEIVKIINLIKSNMNLINTIEKSLN